MVLVFQAALRPQDQRTKLRWPHRDREEQLSQHIGIVDDEFATPFVEAQHALDRPQELVTITLGIELDEAGKTRRLDQNSTEDGERIRRQRNLINALDEFDEPDLGRRVGDLESTERPRPILNHAGDRSEEKLGLVRVAGVDEALRNAGALGDGIDRGRLETFG